MSLRVVININTKPGMGDAFAEAWAPEYDTMAAKPGCVQYELFRSTRNPDHFAILEHWADRASFDAHWAVQSRRERVGGELRDAPENRASGQSGLEIYWERAPHAIVDGEFRPL